MYVVWHSAAVLLAWLCAGAVLAGCGFPIRRLLVARLSSQSPGGLACADLWVGLASLVVYLLLWNLFLPVDWETWLLPAAVALAVGVRGRFPRRLLRGGRTIAAAVLACLGALWFANQALGPAEDYDFGLYHLSLIDYAERYPAVPGLANLHVRLGTGDTHLLFASFLDRGLWSGAGPHLVNGLLATMLTIELASRVARHRPAGNSGPFAFRLALLLTPATFVLAEIRPTHRLSSPNLDFAAFVLFAVGMLYLAEWVERRSATAALTASATLAAAATSRPLYWLATGFVLAIVIPAAARVRDVSRWRTTALVGTLPLVLFLGWTARQAVLSGYPLFPSTLGGLPVDWRVPGAVVHAQNRVNSAWARWAGLDPDAVLGSWRWLTGWWLPRQRWQFDMVFPLLLFSCLLPSLARRGAPDRARRRRTAPMLAVVIPSAATLVVWFFIAPDPRFAWGPIWVVPLGLAAWALPTITRTPSKRTVAAAVVAALAVAAALAWIGIDDTTRVDPAALAVWAAAAAIVLPRRLSRASLLGYASVASVLLAALAILAEGGNIHLVRTSGSGVLGIGPVPTPILVEVGTTSGLHVVEPTNGGDQCWQILLCIQPPAGTDPQLHLRGSSVAAGFSVAPKPPRSAASPHGGGPRAGR